VLAPIRFAGKLTTGDMMRAYKVAWRGTWEMRARRVFQLALMIGGLASFLFAWLSWRDGDLKMAGKHFTFGCIVLICFLFMELSFRRRIVRSLRKGLFTDGEAEVQIDDQGVSLTDGRANLQVPWDKIVGFRSSDEIVIYYIDYPRCFLAFVRRMTSAPAEWDRFKVLSSERLQTM
jgi:hypothetical protein